MQPVRSLPELHALVEQKLTKVFGERRANDLLAEVLREVRLVQVVTSDDLTKVAEALQRRGGFEGTAGAMLAVQAAMRRVSGK